jgi:hypothetical protein
MVCQHQLVLCFQVYDIEFSAYIYDLPGLAPKRAAL